MKKIEFYQFIYIWLKLQNLKLPKHQKKIALWLSKVWKSIDNKQALLMAFRNSGKSTVVGLFCVWLLYQNPSLRILVLAADQALAKKMVKNVKNIIEKHPLTMHLKPQKAQEWASEYFTVNRQSELRDPSMLAKGLMSNLTGLRADVIICDDVEVPKNCDSPLKRDDMREKLSELDYIITPGGMLLYIGTPHSFYTIYQTDFDENKKEISPFLQGFAKLELPILDKNNNSVWPERFSNERISTIRRQSGENKFLSQMMLQAINFTTATLEPAKLISYKDEIEVSYANNKQILKIGDKKMVSASCCWDPAFGVSDKNDASVVACIFVDEEGKIYLHDILYIKVDEKQESNIASAQCEMVADFLEKNFQPSIKVETNGIGKFLPSILKQVLARRGLKVAVIEETTHQNKEEKILKAFELILSEGLLLAHHKIWQTKFIAEMRDWQPNNNAHDDGLDAVASSILSQPVRLQTLANDGTYKNWQGGNTQFSAKVKFDI
ncbi:MAG: phage terminase large subunit [Alphaproteobacteria bacterium]